MWLLLEVLKRYKAHRARARTPGSLPFYFRRRFPSEWGGYRGTMAAPVHDPVGPQPEEPAVRPLPGGPPEPATPIVPDPDPEPLPPEPAPQPM